MRLLALVLVALVRLLADLKLIVGVVDAGDRLSYILGQALLTPIIDGAGECDPAFLAADLNLGSSCAVCFIVSALLAAALSFTSGVVPAIRRMR